MNEQGDTMSDIQTTRVDRIRTLHAEIGGYLRTTIDKAIEVGGLLAEQKAELKHGQWLPWLRDNVPFAERTARDYMRFHEHRDELKTASLADLTDARRLLAGPVSLKPQEMVSILRDHAAALERIEQTYPESVSIPALPAGIWEEAKSVIDDTTDREFLNELCDISYRIAFTCGALTLRSRSDIGGIRATIAADPDGMKTALKWGRAIGILRTRYGPEFYRWAAENATEDDYRTICKAAETDHDQLYRIVFGEEPPTDDDDGTGTVGNL